MKDVFLSEGLEYIEGNAFFNDTNLNTVVLPDSVQTVDQTAFPNYISVIKATPAPKIVSNDFVKETLAQIQGKKVIALKEGVEKLGEKCFKNSDLIEIILPKSLKEIEEDAFDNCNKLEKVVFPTGSSLSVIGNNAFSKCYKL